MSARHIHGLTTADFEKMVSFENTQIKQINCEMRENLDGLEQDVREAKSLVHETQSKVDELVESIGKITKS